MAGPSPGRKSLSTQPNEQSERALPKKHHLGEKLQLFSPRNGGAPDNPRAPATNEKRASTSRAMRPQHPLPKARPAESSSSSSPSPSFRWHKDIMHALRSGKWEHVRGQICLYNAGVRERLNQQGSSGSGSKPASRFLWKRRQTKIQHDEGVDSLLSVDEHGRTPLFLALETSHAPVDVLLQLIRACPAAARIPRTAPRPFGEADSKASHSKSSSNRRNRSVSSPTKFLSQESLVADSCTALPISSRLPLHLAVTNDCDLQVIAALVDSYPPALSAADESGKIPLHYAVEVARSRSGEHHQRQSRRLSWMSPLASEASLYAWQQQQSELWGVVHWLLLSSATYQTPFDVVEGGLAGSTTHHADNRSRKLVSSGDLSMSTLLVEALLSAAPPGVIALLLGVTSSASPQPALRDRSLFSAATIYTCLTRHYPLSILQGIVTCCSAKAIEELRSVRDETNMGLVSACFISGCFAQNEKTTEWNVVPRIWGTLKSILEQDRTSSGQPPQSRISGSIDKLTSDCGFIEWWETLEYLLKLCDGDNSETIRSSSASIPSHSAANDFWLVHAALRNSDTPPWVFRMLTVLYPTQLRLPIRRTGAWPIHLAAQQADYIPRNYEFQIVDHRPPGGSVPPSGAFGGSDESLASSASPCGVLSSIERSFIYRRHRGRLPLHFAIEVGKTLSSLQPLIDDYTLACRDPSTRLYPFQQAAAYAIGSTQDGWRWSCSARNKYSHAVWKGLTDRQKAEAIWRVAQAEDTQRLGTVFVMLRRNPNLIHAGRKPSDSMINSNRDVSRMNMISSHYLSLVTPVNDVKEQSPNADRTSVIDRAISDALESGGQLVHASKDFLRWLQKLKFWIRYCETNVPLPSMACIPQNEDEDFLLHAAVANPDTPPKVVQLLLALFPTSAHRCLPNTSILPLHLAALTPPSVQGGHCVDMVVRSNPVAASCKSEVGWPLHLAVKSGQSWDDLIPIVDADPSVLLRKDDETRFYPFQLAALTPETTPEYFQLHFAKASSRVGGAKWDHLTPLQQVNSVRAELRTERFSRLTTVFELLRSDASVLERYGNHRLPMEGGIASCPWATHSVADDCSLAPELGSREVATSINDCDRCLQGGEFSQGSDSQTSSGDSGNDDSHCSPEPLSNAGHMKGKERPSLLTYFARTTSQRDSFVTKRRSDASIISGVDVMSLVSGVSFTNPRQGRSIASEEKSLNLADLLMDSSSTHDDGSEASNDEDDTGAEFAEDDAPEDTSCIVADPLDGPDSVIASSAEALVFFLMRRTPSVRRSRAEERETTKQVMLSKKDDDRSTPRRSRSMPIDQPLPKDSLRAILFSSRHNPDVKPSRSLHSAVSSQSTSTGNDSFNSTLPEQLGKVGSSTTMMWVTNNLHDTKLLNQAALSQANSSKTSDDESFFSHNSSYASLRRAASGSGRLASQGSIRSFVGSQGSNESDSPRSLASVGRRTTISGSASSRSSLGDSTRSTSRKSRQSDGSVSASSDSYPCPSVQSQRSGSSRTSRRSQSSVSQTIGSTNSHGLKSQSVHSDVSDASTEIGILEASVSNTPTGTGTASFSTFANDAFDDSAHIFGALGNSSHSSRRLSCTAAGSIGSFCLPHLDLDDREDDLLEPLDLSSIRSAGNQVSDRAEFATFDKVTMRWMTASVDEASRGAEVPCSSGERHEHRVNSLFDKKSMRWIPRSETHSSQCAQLNGTDRGDKSGVVNLGLPFVDVMPTTGKQKDRRFGI